MYAACPLDSSEIKDKLVQMQREFNWVGFICANYPKYDI